MSLLTEQEITQVVRDAANGSAIRRDGSISYSIARAIEAKARAKLIEEIKAQGAAAFEYCGEPWFDGNNWHEQKKVTTDKKVAEFKAYLNNPPIPLYKLPEGD